MSNVSWSNFLDKSIVFFLSIPEKLFSIQYFDTQVLYIFPSRKRFEHSSGVWIGFLNLSQHHSCLFLLYTYPLPKKNLWQLSSVSIIPREESVSMSRKTLNAMTIIELSETPHQSLLSVVALIWICIWYSTFAFIYFRIKFYNRNFSTFRIHCYKRNSRTVLGTTQCSIKIASSPFYLHI